MDLSDALSWAGQRKLGILITIRSDGRPQSSDIVYSADGEDLLISLTDSRAKTRNMRRDPRVVLHISDPGTWSYVSFDATVELSPTTNATDDAASDQLVALYEKIAGEAHPDWAEYRQAMIDEQRLIARVTPISAVGQING